MYENRFPVQMLAFMRLARIQDSAQLASVSFPFCGHSSSVLHETGRTSKLPGFGAVVAPRCGFCYITACGCFSYSCCFLVPYSCFLYSCCFLVPYFCFSYSCCFLVPYICFSYACCFLVPYFCRVRLVDASLCLVDKRLAAWRQWA